MPKDTFHKLKAEKKSAITQAFLEEFSQKRYSDASITAVVKSLGIAKGSVYQYFEDKLDLFLYLKQECEAVKMKYVMALNRDDYPDFWAYYRKMYEQGVLFDLENRLESRFLYQLSKNTNDPVIAEFLGQWRDQAVQVFSHIIQSEIDRGGFRDDLSVETMSFFLVTVSQSIGDFLERFYGLDSDRNIEKNKPVFAEQKDVLLKAVDEYIELLKAAFEKK